MSLGALPLAHKLPAHKLQSTCPDPSQVGHGWVLQVAFP